MSASEQAQLLGEVRGNSVSIETDGRTIRPFLALPGAIIDECRLTVTDDGLTITAVDPANVAMVDITIPADAFDAYDIGGETPFELGLPLATLQTQLNDARLGTRTNDPVSLRFDESAARVEISRDYETTTVERADESLLLDPDSIRQTDPPTIDQEAGAAATVDRRALVDVIEHAESVGEHLKLETVDGDLVCRVSTVDNDGDLSHRTTAAFTDTASSEIDGGSVYTLDYLGDFADGFKNGKIDTVTVRFDNEFPAFFDFERTEDDETLYKGTYMIAPRIQKDGGSP